VAHADRIEATGMVARNLNVGVSVGFLAALFRFIKRFSTATVHFAAGDSLPSAWLQRLTPTVKLQPMLEQLRRDKFYTEFM